MFIQTLMYDGNRNTNPMMISVSSIETVYPDLNNGRANCTVIITRRNNWTVAEAVEVIQAKIMAASPLTTEITPDEI